MLSAAQSCASTLHHVLLYESAAAFVNLIEVDPDHATGPTHAVTRKFAVGNELTHGPVAVQSAIFVLLPQRRRLLLGRSAWLVQHHQRITPTAYSWPGRSPGSDTERKPWCEQRQPRCGCYR
jgi:hypothetical protein